MPESLDDCIEVIEGEKSKLYALVRYAFNFDINIYDIDEMYHFDININDIDEMYQEALLRFIRNKTYDSNGDVLQEFREILIREGVDHLRKMSRRKKGGEVSFDDEKYSKLSNGEDEEREIIAQKREIIAQNVNESVDRLGCDYMTMVRMRYFDGVSNGKIGEEFGMPYGTVCWMLYDARKILEASLLQSIGEYLRLDKAS